MKQTTLSKKESPLLDYAMSRLNPEIFLHPVWIRFGRQSECNSPSIIESLFSEAKNLQDDNPSDACQIMLACSVFQNQANQRQNALLSVQYALALAKRIGLTREFFWANWGASAICIQQGNYKQAAIHLNDLQIALSGENEWVLADFVEIVKQSLFYPLSVDTMADKKSSKDPVNNDLIHLTFLWLQQWGSQSQFTETELGATSSKSKYSASIHPKSPWVHFSIQHWHNLVYIFKRTISFLRSPSSHSIRPKQNPQSQATPAKSTSSRTDLSYSVKDETLAYASPYPLKSSLTKERFIEKPTTIISLTVHMFGHFSIAIQDFPLKIPASRGLSLLKYLLIHHKQDTPREVLMDIFWPDTDPEAARNNLNVAMHGLRQALRSQTDTAVIRFEDGAYGIAPNLEIWLDVDEFDRCIKAGQKLETQNQLTTAVKEYEIAVNLYQGDYLADNPYEGWTILDREQFRIAYLNTLDRLSQIYFDQEHYAASANMCQLILARDICREDIHCRLMQCYTRLGQSVLALRQYQNCVEALRVELEVEPAPETKQLFDRIRRHERI